ncbi:BTAD domain-containing putative transcriptional regulator [Leifsonia shinshuensis]|uniref:Putative ATPase/DNA-binding SARP family transcriptional activator n=1 Tax=Leifsonia shinshuensis TaxID=150026 RepID=A0A853CVH8_9MICO|nr:putative ATPase/DNA-binding SARP family transcriptional activator [Leifsonia shinshuensis]
MESAPARPRVAVLGPVLIEDRAGALAEPSGTRGKSLIVALALARGGLSVPALVEDLWDDAPPRQERAALQTLVSRVRTNSADGILESTPSGYALAVGAHGTDLDLARLRLDRARAARSAGDHRGAVDEANAGLALWRGEPGLELAGSRLGEELARTADGLRNELLLVRARSARESGDTATALADLQELLRVRPLDEALHAERIRALADAGRRSDALLAFAELKEALLDRLGTRPGAELVALNARLLAEEDEHEPAAPRRIRIGLRTAPNALVGREYDLEAIEDLVATSRLTTILGAGGLGKTRLAHEVGHRAIHTPTVVLVELASVRTGADVELAFASTLGIREARAVRPTEPGAQLDLRSRILGMLSERETLLIVDNCEHIADAAAAYIEDILSAIPTVRVLATSRAPLAIGAERVYALGPLPSEKDGPAVELFAERARAARPGVVLPPDAVARLCARLDGLPLAIELAAARTRSLSVEEIERRLGNRFALLTGGERTAPERHRTLFAVIDWSWNLLAASEQALMRRLSRFPDGFSADAAEAVAGAGSGSLLDDPVLDDLDALVTQSLVTVSEDPDTGILRYRMLETVREFGDLELVAAGEADDVQAGMDAWAVSFARDALAHMHGPDQVPTFARVTAEQDNLVAVLRSALDGDRPATTAGVFAVLAYYWSLRSTHTEVLGFGTAVLDALAGWEPEGDDRETAATCYALIGGTFLFAGLRTAVRAISRLRRLRRGAPFADPRLGAIAGLVLAAGHVEPGMRLLAEFSRSTDPELAAMGCLLTAQLQENAGELDDALATATRAHEKAIEAQDTWSRASAAQTLAQLHSQLAHPHEALAWAESAHEGLATLRAAGDLRQLDWLIAVNAISAGDVDRGRRLLENYLHEEVDRTGFDYVDYYGIGFAGMAEIALAEGDYARGVRLYDDAIGVYTDDTAVERDATANPWLTILGAALIAARLRAHEAETGGTEGAGPAGADPLSRAETAEAARRLRVRLLVSARLSPPYLDKPVIGTGLLGFAIWMLDAEVGAARGDEWVDAGLELFALAGRSNSRQDIVSLHRPPLAERVRRVWGDERLAAAEAAAATLGRDAAAVRGLEVLGDVRV